MMYKAVAYLPTPYAVLQYLLLRPYSMQDTLFMIDRDRVCHADLINRLPHVKTFFREDEYPFRWYSFIFLYFLSKVCKVVYLSSRPRYKEVVTCYFDHVVYLEDGVASYMVPKNIENKPQPISFKEKLRKKLFDPDYRPLGWADKVEKIYLTGILPVPSGIAGKVELIDLKVLWAKRSVGEQAEIRRIFLPEGLASISGLDREVLLLTQPYSEDSGGRFSEQEKIDVYRTILAGIDESSVLIKKHPREVTDYKKYFPRAEVLQTLCPMELLEILGMNVKKAITINSTAIYNLDHSVEKIITGTSVTHRLEEEIIFRDGL